MRLDEYMKDLTEQIGNKRAKQLVVDELKNHIEEQTESYEADGMEHECAVEEAVRQMGDPVAVGVEMNKIHKARFPYLMYAIAVILTIFGIVLQSKIFLTIDNGGLRWLGIPRSIVSNIMGLGLALAIIFMDYTVIAKHVGKILIAYFILLAVMPVIAYVIPYYQGILLLNLIIAIFPILFAAYIYKQRGKEWKGVLKCMNLLFGTMIFTFFYVQCYLTGFWAETVLICLCLFMVAILKGIMGQQKIRMSILTMAFPVGIFGIFFIRIMPLATYQTARIDAMLHPEKYMNENYNYTGTMLYRLSQQFTAGGQHNFANYEGYLPTTQMHTDFAVNSMFSWFGIVVGCIVLGMLFLFCLYSLYIAWKQSNRMGFLFGTVCSTTLLIRMIFYVLINFGKFVSYSSYFPFLKYGIGNALINGVYIGIIMCVYRNSDILGEHGMKEYKSKYRLHVSVEKNG